MDALHTPSLRWISSLEADRASGRKGLAVLIDPDHARTPDDLAWIAYTGGTTGKPKGVMRNHRALGAIAQGVLANFEWPETPV